jgi:hypothetical protein
LRNSYVVGANARILNHQVGIGGAPDRDGRSMEREA